MKKAVLCVLVWLAMMQIGQTQSTRYIIQFKDKGTNPYSFTTPQAFLSQRALDRRIRYGISIDSTDLPVTPRYVDSVRQAGAVTILNVSKWLNSVTIQTTDAAALQKINSFPFVKSSAPIAARMAGQSPDKSEAAHTRPFLQAQRGKGIASDFFDYGSAYAQVHIHHGEFLHNIGLRGQGMIIGMLDAGFQNYLTVRAFDSARANGQILGTWDFVARDTNVNEDNAHGMQCLSTIAANIPGQFVGTAPKASFFLFRSEDASSEYPIEEHNWVCAAERVDSAGGDLISSSLGYNLFDNAAFNHSYADLNGNTTMAAIGADLAAKKGILVVNSAGNEGNNSWGKIVTPADGDSVLAVGAVNAAGTPAGFTSRGPSADGRVKPDVASVGVATVVQLQNNMLGTNNGTSFSAPNLAGLTACLWQGFPEFNNMKIVTALQQSGNRAAQPNDTIGYGIPDVRKALLLLLKDFATSEVSVAGCKAILRWNSKDAKGMRYEIERLVADQGSFTKIAQVSATGNGFSNQSYQYEDDLTDIPKGGLGYRIRQIIDTAATAFAGDYIDTASVAITSSCLSGTTAVSLWPNPSTGALQVKVNTPTAIQNLVISLYNPLGQRIAEIKKSKAEGAAIFDVPVYSLPAGKFYVSVYDSKALIETKELIRL